MTRKSSEASTESYVSKHFDEVEYLRRLKLMREIISGENQTDFAARLGVTFKRWANYERGYPVSRQVAWKLWDDFGVSVEWLWYGAQGNVKPIFLERLKAAEDAEKEHRLAEKQLKAATERLEKAALARRKATRSKQRRAEQPSS